MFYTKYDGSYTHLNGVLHTNLQNGKGYCFFQELNLILLIESDSQNFLKRGETVNVKFLNHYTVGTEMKKTSDNMNTTINNFKVRPKVKELLSTLFNKRLFKCVSAEDMIQKSKIDKIKEIEQRIFELVDETQRIVFELNNLKAQLNDINKEMKNNY